MRSSWSALNAIGPVRVAAIHLRADLKCAWCGEWIWPLERQVDHVIPRAAPYFGLDIPENLVLACQKCNAERGAGRVVLPPKARKHGRTLRIVRAEVKRQASIPIGPGSRIHREAVKYAQECWPEQMARRARARAAWLERQAFEFFGEAA